MGSCRYYTWLSQELSISFVFNSDVIPAVQGLQVVPGAQWGPPAGHLPQQRVAADLATGSPGQLLSRPCCLSMQAPDMLWQA